MSTIGDYNELKSFVEEVVNEVLEMTRQQEKADEVAKKDKKSVSDLVEEKIKSYGIR